MIYFKMDFLSCIFCPSVNITTLVTTTLFILTLVCYYFNYRFKSGNLPPGPFCLPIVGYCPFLTSEPYRKLEDLKNKYGDVFGITLGTCYSVVIGENDLFKEAFSKSSYLGKPIGQFHLSDDYTNIIEMSGGYWAEHYKFILTTLKMLNGGRDGNEKLIKNQLAEVLKRLEKHNDQDVHISHELALVTDNVILKLLFGKTYKKTDPIYQTIEEYQEIQYLMDATSIAQNNAFLKPYILMFNPTLKRVMAAFTVTEEIIKQEIKKHEKEFDENVINDFIDAFLLKIQASDGQKDFTKGTLLGHCLLLLVAGSHTARSTLEWLFLQMAEEPEIQEKVYSEIIDALGTNKEPNWADHVKFPYTEAVILESSRRRTLAPLSLPRITFEDSKLNGFDIPKGTQILTNLYAIQNDPKVFKDPEKFSPERFLNNKGQINPEMTKMVMSFSYGKRRCVGEQIANVEVFLIFVTIMQKFLFLPPKDGLRMDSFYRTTYNPKYPIVRVQKR